MDMGIRRILGWASVCVVGLGLIAFWISAASPKGFPVKAVRSGDDNRSLANSAGLRGMGKSLAPLAPKSDRADEHSENAAVGKERDVAVRLSSGNTTPETLPKALMPVVTVSRDDGGLEVWCNGHVLKMAKVSDVPSLDEQMKDSANLMANFLNSDDFRSLPYEERQRLAGKIAEALSSSRVSIASGTEGFRREDLPPELANGVSDAELARVNQALESGAATGHK